MVTKSQAEQAIINIFNFCEEIDNHLPDDEKSGYKMFPDFEIVRNFINESEKLGYWSNYNDYLNGYRCSCCKLIHRNCTKYCPHCGAKMDEKRIDFSHIETTIMDCLYFTGKNTIDKSEYGTHVGECSASFNHEKCPSPKCACAKFLGLKG